MVMSSTKYMTKINEMAEIVIKMLNDLYPKPPIPLFHHDEFTLLVAVVLSSQSTDKKVNEITPNLFKSASTPEAMRKLGQVNIYNKIRKLGLSKQKSKYLYELSDQIITKFSGQIPSNFEDLESLSGVGHKTASVVMAQSFGVPTFPVDTHIHRLAQRWAFTSGKNVKQTEKDLKRIFPKSMWNILHLQIIFYGREYCTARGCDGTKCMICRKLFPNRKSGISFIRP